MLLKAITTELHNTVIPSLMLLQLSRTLSYMVLHLPSNFIPPPPYRSFHHRLSLSSSCQPNRLGNQKWLCQQTVELTFPGADNWRVPKNSWAKRCWRSWCLTVLPEKHLTVASLTEGLNSIEKGFRGCKLMKSALQLQGKE